MELFKAIPDLNSFSKIWFKHYGSISGVTTGPPSPTGAAPHTPSSGGLRSHQRLCPWTPLVAAPPNPCSSELGGANRRLARVGQM